ncbi:hypothetical protein ABEF92_007905 [Exophiala dermatitidis]|uniref:SUN domain-containing protein n=1 Tax=Exophiala dermatitidis (strain ATCC 34100 / CBS 525.76 / NIH/UT8656) TaxID=858893 RepID=H6BRJ4_EXODN|nr:uncharacterized protein HMPREF1120_02176 [Exophiala dermatitidis NIH/UT8656]EHY53999.1 hypothetical protein HMPREF1120_02176 [Exophiala dermatitidis NIH/UT8656]
MPPRRSTARLSATPIRASSPTKRSTRGSSVLASEDAIPRRVTRGGSQQPSMAAEGAVNNPRLPEVQIQQSYAYGSSKSAVLPAQLVARNKMNLREMAETIDAGVEQAQQHLQHHIEETHAQLQNETDPRAERARRRASREPASREGSVTTDDVEKNKSQRVAAWASSLESSQLDEIPEEDSSSGRPPSTPDNATHKDTDPSSFPSGIFDHSYNYERGLRRPNVTVRRKTGGDSTLQQAWKTAKTIADQSRQASARALGATAQWTSRLFRASGRAISDLPNSVFVQVMVSLLFGLFVATAASFLFCHIYTSYICDAHSSSPIGVTLQRYCGGCVRASSSPLNFTLGANGGDLSKLSAALSGIQSQIQAIEGRLSEKLDSQYTIVDTDIKELRRQHSELSSHIAGLQRVRGGGSVSSSGDVASPVIAKVNYFAPNNGANVDPHNTSPTRERRQALVSRVLSRMVGMTLYETKPAITALQPWQDVGDYWCSSASPANNDDQQDSMRLGVRVAEMIFPTEVVVENYPNAGSLFPGSTPKRIQVWADFQHLDSREWESLNIRQMQADGPLSLGPTYALIGEVEYDASVEAPHVQAFPLAVNQHDIHLYAAQSFVVRVVKNYGAEYTCLYRIRMHGVPALQYHDGR